MTKFVPFDTVVRNACAMAGDNVASGYGQMARFVVMALQDMALAIPSVRTESMRIADNLTIDLPPDCTDVLKVGKMHGNYIHVFGRYDNIRLNVKSASCSCDETANPESGVGVCAACTFHGVYCADGTETVYYGARPSQFDNGRYRYNREANRLEFDSNGYDVQPGGLVVVEYCPAASTETARIIPVEAQQVIIRRALTFATVSMPGMSLTHHQNFRMEYNRLRAQYNRMTVHDWVAAIKGERTQAIR
jgi:hypothetical protein